MADSCPQHSMKTLSLLAVAGLLLTSGCYAPRQINNHWTASSVFPRAIRQATGFNPDLDQSWLDHQAKHKREINQTLYRHFFNWNESNPFQRENPRYAKGRELNSPFSNPLYYVHLDVGLSSLIGTTTSWEGVKEFGAGLKPRNLFSGWSDTVGAVGGSFLHGFYGPDGAWHTTFDEGTWEKRYRKKLEN